IKLQLAAYPISNYMAGVPVTEADLQAYLKQRKTKYALNDMRRYAYAKLALLDLKEKVQVTTAALQAYYEKNQAKFSEKAAFRAQEIFAATKDRKTSDVVSALKTIRPKLLQAKDWKPIADEWSKAHPKLSVYARETEWLSADDTRSRSQLYLQRAAA